MRKIMTIFGTRPEAIKMAPVLYRLRESPREWKSIICVTAQHREMLDQVLLSFGIQPDYDLGIMQKDQNLFDVSSKVLIGLREILQSEKPDLVLVQGDTTTALIAALASFYSRIPIGHVEAGLRTYRKYSPFPEEKNRHLLSVLSDYQFAPTELARSNLLREGLPKERIWVTGNTVIDALLYIRNRQKESGDRWINYFRERYALSLNFDDKKLLLITGHRRENFGKPFENICQALKEVALRRKDVTVVYPVHLNSNVQQPVHSILDGLPNVHLIEPLGYEPFVFLMSQSYLILTDSGGIQEEAPSLGKPVLVMRETTERPEGIRAGTTRLVGTGKESIKDGVLELLENQVIYDKMAQVKNPYGDGKAAERIVAVLSCSLSGSEPQGPTRLLQGHEGGLAQDAGRKRV